MEFQAAQFITSAVSLQDCPEESLPEFCFAGRSNVGKSSIINKLTNKKRLARTSNTPGKTQQMNYYRIDNRCYLVDLPGFGFAKVPQKERIRWGKDIQKYLLERSSLELVFHLVDCRHKPTSLDEEFFYWLGANELPFAVILSKSDKLSGNKLASAVSQVKHILKDMNIEVPVLTASADTGQGVEAIQDLILEFLDDTRS